MNAREVALKILYNVEYNGAYSDKELKKELANKDIKSIDKGLITELVYGVNSNKTRLDYAISKYSKTKLSKISPWVLIILRLGVYQILMLDKIPQSAACNESVNLAKKYGHKAVSGFVNGILRSVCRNGDVSYPKGRDYYIVYYSHPKWLVDMLCNQYGEEEAFKIIQSGNAIKKTTIRCNITKITPDELKKILENAGITVTNTEYDNILEISGFGDISKTDEYKNGLFTPQDISAYLAAKEIDAKENDVIIDMCAAPGGKTTEMAEMSFSKAKIIAFDKYEHKIKIINNNAKRLGLKNIDAKTFDSTVFDEKYDSFADKILADVPCSGLGIISKKPDIKWKKSLSDIDEIIKIQKQILSNAAKYVKCGGIIIYSTCTINDDENNGIRKWFEKNYDFVAENYKTIMPYEGKDGFYICKFRRKDGKKTN